MTNSADAPLGDLLRYYQDQGCKGIGEYFPNIPFDDPLNDNVFAAAQDVGVDGLEICRRLRAERPHVPVLMLTARSTEGRAYVIPPVWTPLRNTERLWRLAGVVGRTAM